MEARLLHHTGGPDAAVSPTMPAVQLYFSAALLLLLATCPVWQPGRAAPAAGKGQVTDSCVFYARTLLQNITRTLTLTKLFSGIDCMKQSVELNTGTKTPPVCAPKGSTCSEITPSEFDKESCLMNIGEDLSHYSRFLAAQPDPDSLLRSSVLSSLRELMEKCFPGSPPAKLPVDEAAAARLTTYDQRLGLCKVLKGFQVRAITINRALANMNAAENTKSACVTLK